jgi:hypothetical protein
MTQFSKHFSKSGFRASLDETDALLFENAQLRETATELLLQTTILREALLSDQTRPAYSLD